MDAVTDPTVKRIVGMFSAQTAKTTIIENIVAYHAHHDPCPIMVVQPTLEIAEAFSKDRLAPMIRDTPALKARFAEAGSKTSGDTLLHKKFPGGAVVLAGANSYNSLASRPIRIVIHDEAAKYKPNEKGSPFRQAAARVKGFYNSKLIYLSTPTDASQENEFNEIWEQSNKQLFGVPCPGCDGRIVYAFDETPGSLPTTSDTPRAILKWQEGLPFKTDDGRKIRRADAAWFECLACGYQIGDTERHRSVKQGEFFPTQEFYGTAGFWGWQGMSPFSSALDIADDWLGALGSLAAVQSVKNETLGLQFTEAGEAPDWKRLFDRRDLTYQIGTVPDGALILTAGTDVQQDRIEIQVIGWGRRQQCWLVDYITLDGDTSRPEVWADLTKILAIVYRNASGADFTIQHMAVDSGFATMQVYDWARRHKFAPVTVVKGGTDQQGPTVTAGSEAEISTLGRKLRTGIKMFSVNVSRLKNELYRRLNLALPNLEKGEEYPDGFFHFCALPDTEEYCRQLTAEQLKTRNVKGYAKQEWEKIRPRNEALDTWNYAAVAAIRRGVDRFGEAQWRQLENQTAQTVSAENVPQQTPRISGPVPRPKTQIRLGGF
jgi:phage terminase large subunit GpA-like protein